MKSVDITTIGGRIRRARINCHLTTRELAERTGVTQNYLSIIERDDTKQASPTLIKKIAEVTGVTLEWLRDGISPTVDKVTCAEDLPLLLTLVMQQGTGITKETVATVLDVNTEVIDGILSGQVDYNPRWENGLLNLVRRLDLPAVQKKLQTLIGLFQQENMQKMLWTFQEYLAGKYNTVFEPRSEPELIPENPSYTRIELRREDTLEMWTIRYYPSADNDVFEDILRQAETVCSRANVGIAFDNEETYNNMYNFYYNRKGEMELSQDLNAARGMSSSPVKLPSIKLFLMIGEAVKDAEDLSNDNSDCVE